MFKGAWGRCPGQASGEENHGGIFFPAGLCVLTQALLAGFSVPRIYALSGGISPNEKRGRLHILLLIIRIFQFDGSVNDTFHNGQIFLRAKL